MTEITSEAGGRKRRKRVGRGTGSGRGKTSGRGHKGLGQRSGGKQRLLFEGGSSPLYMRLPKVGFSNAKFARHYAIVNVGVLDEVFEEGDRVTREALLSARLIASDRLPVKVLGEGELKKKLVVEAQRFSKKAAERIEAVGGEAHVVPHR
ncbi:MAG: 50S ribosomal protein L15 [Phycisphaerales bacterium]|nr:MAG: 50S ribosomal protein L15 [Phycisphaerales bacterium]